MDTLASVRWRGTAIGFALVLTACTQTVAGTAVDKPSAPAPYTGVPGATPQLASAGPRIAVPKADTVPPCSIATAAQLGATVGPPTGEAAPLAGNPNSCIWPLGSGPRNGVLAGYGVSYDEVMRAHPAAAGAFERQTDGNSTWLWCDVSDQTGAFTCGAAVAISADRTFVTGLVRSPAAGRTKTTVLAELQPVTIALFRSLPGL